MNDIDRKLSMTIHALDGRTKAVKQAKQTMKWRNFMRSIDLDPDIIEDCQRYRAIYLPTTLPTSNIIPFNKAAK